MVLCVQHSERALHSIDIYSLYQPKCLPRMQKEEETYIDTPGNVLVELVFHVTTDIE